ncbi:MAG: hypothetical protein PHY80_00820 [Rickettsiales bacterium]|nr:hypothetical protein [Rickettsiales bacterium]
MFFETGYEKYLDCIKANITSKGVVNLIANTLYDASSQHKKQLADSLISEIIKRIKQSDLNFKDYGIANIIVDTVNYASSSEQKQELANAVAARIIKDFENIVEIINNHFIQKEILTILECSSLQLSYQLARTLNPLIKETPNTKKLKTTIKDKIQEAVAYTCSAPLYPVSEILPQYNPSQAAAAASVSDLSSLPQQRYSLEDKTATAIVPQQNRPRSLMRIRRLSDESIVVDGLNTTTVVASTQQSFVEQFKERKDSSQQEK